MFSIHVTMRTKNISPSAEKIFDKNLLLQPCELRIFGTHFAGILYNSNYFLVTNTKERVSILSQFQNSRLYLISPRTRKMNKNAVSNIAIRSFSL